MRTLVATLSQLAVLLAFAGPATAATHTQRARLGAVSATITWKSDAYGQLIHDFRVTITRAQTTFVDGPVTTDNEWLSPAGWRDGSAVAVRDLDLDGEPEVIVDTYSGGAHCCTVTKLWSFDGTGYTAVAHDWGNTGYRLGATLLVGADDFSYAFSSYVGSVSPVLVLDARLRDVTKQHPRIVERDLRRVRRLYSREPFRAVLAAYVADLHSLGRHAEAERLLERAKRDGVLRRHGRYDAGPFDNAFLRRLDRMLRDRGYISANSESAVSTI